MSFAEADDVGLKVDCVHLDCVHVDCVHVVVVGCKEKHAVGVQAGDSASG